MKKSFKKLGFFSLATSSVLLGSMNATDLETYAALQKPSHVFGNYAEKDKDSKLTSDSPTQQQAQTQAQNTAQSDSKEATTLENTASTDNITATTDEAYTTSTDTTVADAAKQVETDNTAVQNAETALQKAVTKVENDAKATNFDETTFQADQQAEQTAETNLQKAENQLTNDQSTLETALKDQTPSTPPATSGGTGGDKHTASSGTPSASGSSVASQLTKDTTMVNNLKSVSVSGMNTTLSGVETMSQQSATISALLSGNPNLGSVISNAQGLNSAFSALESAQNTLKGYLNSSSATIGQLTNGSNAVVGALDKAINQVDMALADLSATDTQKTQAVTLATASDSSTTTTDAINFLNALKSNLMAQKDAFMNVHKNIQTAVAQAQATYTPSVINTNNYGQMYGVDAMAGYKWFFGKTKRFGFRSLDTTAITMRI